MAGTGGCFRLRARLPPTTVSPIAAPARRVVLVHACGMREEPSVAWGALNDECLHPHPRPCVNEQSPCLKPTNQTLPANQLKATQAGESSRTEGAGPASGTTIKRLCTARTLCQKKEEHQRVKLTLMLTGLTLPHAWPLPRLSLSCRAGPPRRAPQGVPVEGQTPLRKRVGPRATANRL